MESAQPLFDHDNLFLSTSFHLQHLMLVSGLPQQTRGLDWIRGRSLEDHRVSSWPKHELHGVHDQNSLDHHSLGMIAKETVILTVDSPHPAGKSRWNRWWQSHAEVGVMGRNLGSVRRVNASYSSFQSIIGISQYVGGDISM
jgi:hypothetical protein